MTKTVANDEQRLKNTFTLFAVSIHVCGYVPYDPAYA